MQSPLEGRIEWVIARCRLLQAIGAEYDDTKPFAGLTIGTGIHLEPKTVALLLTLPPRASSAAPVRTRDEQLHGV